MKSVDIFSFKTYRIGTIVRLSPEHVDQLIGVFAQPTQAAASLLGGRTAVSKTRLNGFGTMVIKHYRRGGWIRHLVERTYLRWGKPRCRVEFDMLQEARRLGVRVPEPIAFAYKGRICYRCWLVMREISIRSSLAEMGRSDPQLAVEMIPGVADQIRRLIENRIWHVDLHPGNVLVDGRNQVHLIDFDRARVVQWEPALIGRKYLSRWERAVSKHCLPPQLTRALKEALGPF